MEFLYKKLDRYMYLSNDRYRVSLGFGHLHEELEIYKYDDVDYVDVVIHVTDNDITKERVVELLSMFADNVTIKKIKEEGR